MAKAKVGVSLFSFFFVCSAAEASIITFDKLPISGVDDIVPDGYHGFTWQRFGYLDAVNVNVFGHGLVSPKNLAYTPSYGIEIPAVIMVDKPNKVFDFNQVYLTAAWNDELNITIEGWLNGALQQSQTIVVNTDNPTNFTFNYLGIDELRFFSFGGIYGGGVVEGNGFLMDNLEYSLVPEPLTLLGASAAVAFGAAFKRRRAQ